MILITTTILVDIRITFLIKQHTGHRDPETGEWQTDPLSNTLAHALAGATGAAVGENAANIISHILYPNKAAHELSLDEKEKVSGIASIAGAMAGSIAGGGESIADAVTGGLASKNAVENNRLISRLGWQLIKPSELAPGMLPVTPELIASTILVENIGIDANTAKEFVNGLTPEQMLELNKLGVDIKEGAYSPAYQQALLDFYRKNGHQTTIATDPNELPKLEGYPIPESTKPKIIGTPLPDQEKETGRFETPILEQDKNADILPGTEINVGDWRDNILTAENGDPAFKNGYVWKPNVDVDLRGTGKTFQDALDEAFKRTGHNKSEFIPVRWSKTSDGKSIPVQYNGPNGATINVDIGHTGSHSLGVPHIGYKVGKKDKIVGHILLDNVPANRYPGQPLEK